MHAVMVDVNNQQWFHLLCVIPDFVQGDENHDMLVEGVLCDSC